MAGLVRGTLGPKARAVAIQPVIGGSKPPEILDDAATILRRVIELPNPAENIGAMILRQLTWKVREEVGDGTATAAVIAQTLLSEANRYVAAGGNAMRIKVGIESGYEIAQARLKEFCRPIDDPKDMSRLIAGVTSDAELGEMFGEIYDLIGQEAVVIIQDSQGTRTQREYVEGVQWDQGYLSPYFATNTERMECVLEDALVLVTNRNITTTRELVPALDQVKQAGFSSLFIVANDVSGDALALLVANKNEGTIKSLAVKAPGYGDRRMGILGDLAVLTGGRFVNEDAGDTVADVKIGDFGRAVRIWSDRANFNVIGGYGEANAIRERITNLRKEIPSIKDEYEQQKARERLGKLKGGVAVVNVGAPTETAQKEKRVRVESAVAAMRAAGEGGVVPGGGAALLACARAVRSLNGAGDEHFGRLALAAALEAPLRWIVKNGGFKDAAIVAELGERPDGWGFNVLQGRVSDVASEGILDPYAVLRVALEKAVSGASMAITLDTLVLHKKPTWVAQP
jgi:chaperonin GroEL